MKKDIPSGQVSIMIICINLFPMKWREVVTRKYLQWWVIVISDEVVLCTLPDRPCPPHKPQLKGRVNAYGFKVRWDPPSDTGGMPISAFALQIDQGNGYEEIYRGTEGECTVDRLSPGQSYALRVITIGPGGESDPSESCVITTGKQIFNENYRFIIYKKLIN